jgi:hypothetical protein
MLMDIRKLVSLKQVLRIQRIHMFLGLRIRILLLLNKIVRKTLISLFCNFCSTIFEKRCKCTFKKYMQKIF